MKSICGNVIQMAMKNFQTYCIFKVGGDLFETIKLLCRQLNIYKLRFSNVPTICNHYNTWLVDNHINHDKKLLLSYLIDCWLLSDYYNITHDGNIFKIISCYLENIVCFFKAKYIYHFKNWDHFSKIILKIDFCG